MSPGQERGIVFAGASVIGRGTPWGTLAEIVAPLIEQYGYRVRIEPSSWGTNNGRWVGDGRAELGAWNLSHLIQCSRGTGAFSEDGPRDRLRVIAHINQPGWTAIGVRAEAGITDLSQILSQQRAVRIRIGPGRATEIILEHYGLTKEAVEALGGELRATNELLPSYDSGSAPVAEPQMRPWVLSGEFDVIIDSVYSGYAPEVAHWTQASILHDLSFLALPDEVVKAVTAEDLGVPGFIPHRLFRGLWYDVASAERLPQVIYCRADTPEDFVHMVAQSLDENRERFRHYHLPYSYDPANVGVERGVPVHDVAKEYYRSVGFPTA